MTAALAYLAAINLAAFVVMAWDKACARQGVRRIPERTLLTLAAAGGSPGAIAAQRALRHKTRKQPFARQLGLILAVQAALAAAAAFAIR